MLWNHIICDYKSIIDRIVYYIDANYYNGTSIGFLSGLQKVSEQPGFWNYWCGRDKLMNRDPSNHKVIQKIISKTNNMLKLYENFELIRHGQYCLKVPNAGTITYVYNMNA